MFRLLPMLMILSLSLEAQNQIEKLWLDTIKAMQNGDMKTVTKNTAQHKLWDVDFYTPKELKDEYSDKKFKLKGSFIDSKKDLAYVHYTEDGEELTDVVRKLKGQWKITGTEYQKINSQKQSDQYRKALKVEDNLMLPLKNIGQKVAVYFLDGEESLIPEAGKMKISKEELFVKDIISGKTIAVHIVKGYEYMGSAVKILALPVKPNAGRYYAAFEDGSVRRIKKEDWEKTLKETGYNGKRKKKRSEIESID